MSKADETGRTPLTPPTDWGSTGVQVPDLAGGYSLPSGINGDLDRRKLFADIIASLYSAVGSAQRADLVPDETRNAVHQLVVANAALAASEADGFLTLISAGLEAPALIHLRALGEMVRRIAICREYPHLALLLYKTSASAWKRLASKLPMENAPTFDKSEKDMRDLENTKPFKIAKADVIKRFHVLNDIEWTMFSKRSHGDIFALVQVSNNLRTRDANVRTAINIELPEGLASNGLLVRAIGFALFGLLHIVAEFGIDTRGRVGSLKRAFEEMQERDELSGALRMSPPGAQNL
jgi:hypothetical protein